MGYFPQVYFFTENFSSNFYFPIFFFFLEKWSNLAVSILKTEVFKKLKFKALIF